MAYKQGVKGADVYTEEGVGDKTLVLYQMLVRNSSPIYIEEAIHTAFTDPSTTDSQLKDYLVLAFQTRDIRGGKGERDLFYTMLLAILKERPSLIRKAINLIPEYGCWRDCWKIWGLTVDNSATIQAIILDLVRWIYFEDLSKLDAGKSVSLLGKWLPREGSKYDHLAKVFANDFHSSIELQDDSLPWQGEGREKNSLTATLSMGNRLRQYRLNCVRLNEQLRTVEVDMCRATWAKINPATVPGRLLKRNRKAFLNENSKDGHLRWPSDKDRMDCRENFIQHTRNVLAGKAALRGADVVYPHEIVQSFLTDRMTAEEESVAQAQWNAIRDAVASGGGLRGCVPMSDFSGSMSGIPMYVSMALGILISEINDPAFKDSLVGFDQDPSWISFKGMTTLREKINHSLQFAQGLNTDFLKAAFLILDRLVEQQVPVDQAPKDLLVFTDMGFDAAKGLNTNWETQLTTIKNAFVEKGYSAPRIVVWNLRAEYKDFHARAHTEGVVMLSGWSPSALKTLQTNGVVLQTPYAALRELLDSPRYDRVREAWNQAKSM